MDTAGKSPFFTFLVPTRDRPEFIKYSLESLKRQQFGDFEVIVSDNYTTHSCREAFDAIADERFRYLTPPSPLSMADNWEFALQHAKGEYIGILIDKTILFPSTLQAAFDAVRKEPVEIVSWWNENYYLQNEAAGYGPGTYGPSSLSSRPERIDPTAELQRRFSFDVRRGLEGRHYFWGKICFGVYHRDLIARIKSRLGRVFFPLSPDYTSMLAALALTDSAIDLGRPYLMSFSSLLSTGGSNARNAETAKIYLLQHAPGITENFPVPGVYSSHHNSVAYDYLRMQERLGGQLQNLHLNFENLVCRMDEDLELQEWNNDSEMVAQKAIVASHLGRMSKSVRLRHRLSRLVKELAKARQSIQFFPTFRNLLRPFARRHPKLRNFAKTMLLEQDQIVREPRQFSSILEAVAAADNIYSRQLSAK